jgi:hypothetical protein
VLLTKIVATSGKRKAAIFVCFVSGWMGTITVCRLKYAVLLVSYGTGQTGALAREKRSYVCVWGASLAE